MHPDFTLRTARQDEIPLLNALIKESANALSQKFYTQTEIDALNQYVFSVDTALVADHTYFVIVHKSGALAACGGFSKRKKLFGGDQYAEQKDEFLDPNTEPAKIRAFFVHPNYARQGLATTMLAHCEKKASEEGFCALELMATLPGVPFYETQGFIGQGTHRLDLKNGVSVQLVPMHKKMALSNIYKKRSNSGSSWDAVKKNKVFGLAKGQTFPEIMVYNPKTKSEQLLSTSFAKGKKTIIVRQPGFTPPGYWGKTHDLET